jgi:hypothetical protein
VVVEDGEVEVAGVPIGRPAVREAVVADGAAVLRMSTVAHNAAIHSLMVAVGS